MVAPARRLALGRVEAFRSMTHPVTRGYSRVLPTRAFTHIGRRCPDLTSRPLRLEPVRDNLAAHGSPEPRARASTVPSHQRVQPRLRRGPPAFDATLERHARQECAGLPRIAALTVDWVSIESYSGSLNAGTPIIGAVAGSEGASQRGPSVEFCATGLKLMQSYRHARRTSREPALERNDMRSPTSARFPLAAPPIVMLDAHRWR